VPRESHRSTLNTMSSPCLRFTIMFRILIHTMPTIPVVQVLLQAGLPECAYIFTTAIAGPTFTWSGSRAAIVARPCLLFPSRCDVTYEIGMLPIHQTREFLYCVWLTICSPISGSEHSHSPIFGSPYTHRSRESSKSQTMDFSIWSPSTEAVLTSVTGCDCSLACRLVVSW
jgi:hypothetical protein